MKNVVKVSLICIVLIATLIIPTTIKAASGEGYTIGLEYNKSIIAGEKVDATAILKGTDATPYTNARINFEITGPATPSVIAYEEDGTPVDVMKYGYYGPEGGFLVGNTFENRTRIEAEFPKAGEYTLTMSLVDMSNDKAVIASETYTISVGLNVTVVIDGNEQNYTMNAPASFDSLKISTPEKEGYKFVGWYTDANFENALDTTAVLDENTTVYAKFEVIENNEGNTDNTGDSNTTEEEQPAAEEGEKDETPKTGVANYLGIAAGVAIIATVAVISLKKRNN